MPRYEVTLTEEEIKELERQIQKGDSCINQREEVCQKRDTPLQ